MRVIIGRCNGKITDIDGASAEFTEAEIQVVKDTLAMVNKVTCHKENWYVEVNGTVIIPVGANETKGK